MTKYITITGKGQITVPMQVRRSMGLDKEGAAARLEYDPATNRLYLERVVDIDVLQAMNQKILQRNQQQAIDYQSGDGFRSHTQKKYGL